VRVCERVDGTHTPLTTAHLSSTLLLHAMALSGARRCSQGDTDQLMDCVIQAEAEVEAEDMQDVKSGKKTMGSYLKEHEKDYKPTQKVDSTSKVRE
jgi:hypothetical protein